VLNFGARRLRASKLAGHTEIPAFVDETADSYDQVIENEHRQALKPLELALFVERQLKAGQSKAEVARRLGKSRAYLTYICALIDAPDWLLELYRSGRCRGPLELYEARLLGESDPNAVREMLEAPKPMTRAEIVARPSYSGRIPPVAYHRRCSQRRAQGQLSLKQPIERTAVGRASGDCP
jgi:ParB family chromosome partitioning protein